jgi:hypothetical protein
VWPPPLQNLPNERASKGRSAPGSTPAVGGSMEHSTTPAIEGEGRAKPISGKLRRQGCANANLGSTWAVESDCLKSPTLDQKCSSSFRRLRWGSCSLGDTLPHGSAPACVAVRRLHPSPLSGAPSFPCAGCDYDMRRGVPLGWPGLPRDELTATHVNRPRIRCCLTLGAAS